MREIFFVLRSGIRWEDLPDERGCSGMTCWRRRPQPRVVRDGGLLPLRRIGPLPSTFPPKLAAKQGVLSFPVATDASILSVCGESCCTLCCAVIALEVLVERVEVVFAGDWDAVPHPLSLTTRSGYWSASSVWRDARWLWDSRSHVGSPALRMICRKCVQEFPQLGEAGITRSAKRDTTSCRAYVTSGLKSHFATSHPSGVSESARTVYASSG
jgi:hypothetical protein